MKKKFRKNQLQEMWNTLSHRNREVIQSKLYHKLGTINDGVIAIILTIMALQIRLPVETGSYQVFLIDVGIYFVSFFVVADFWYDMSMIFTTFEKITHFQVIINFLFLVSLSLFPVMTKWVMNDLNRLAIINYGVLYFITKILLYLLFYLGNKETAKKTGAKMGTVLVWRVISLLGMNLLLIGIAMTHPLVAMILYVSLPIGSFLWPLKRR